MSLNYIYTIGRRKSAIAQVRLYSTSGESTINGKSVNEYIHRNDLFPILYSPIKSAGLSDKVRFEIKVQGSGESSQVQAMRQGLSRAIVESDSNLRKVLKDAGFLTRDPRVVERKKPGLHKARKVSQWSKR